MVSRTCAYNSNTNHFSSKKAFSPWPQARNILTVFPALAKSRSSCSLCWSHEKERGGDHARKGQLRTHIREILIISSVQCSASAPTEIEDSSSLGTHSRKGQAVQGMNPSSFLIGNTMLLLQGLLVS